MRTLPVVLVPQPYATTTRQPKAKARASVYSTRSCFSHIPQALLSGMRSASRWPDVGSQVFIRRFLSGGSTNPMHTHPTHLL